MNNLRLAISDLFFNSKEAEEEKYLSLTLLQDNVIRAQNWLDKYPYFKQFISAEELAKDFMRRIKKTKEENHGLEQAKAQLESIKEMVQALNEARESNNDNAYNVQILFFAKVHKII